MLEESFVDCDPYQESYSTVSSATASSTILLSEVQILFIFCICAQKSHLLKTGVYCVQFRKSVIERAGNPSAFTITRPHSSIAEPTQPSYNVPNLSELAYRAINADRNEVNYPTNFIFERCKTTRRPYASSVTHRRNVVYCKHCKLLFYERNDFYEHFKQSSCAMPACAEDIIHVQCRGAECIPAEYEYGRRSCLITLQSNATMECTACGLSSREFSSCADFHRHLFNCDSTTINQQIKQSRNVTNYNSQQITH
ncbi:unnamed protein product [Anisakis simplex]|uniref:C2H2-type domain-containing protein n=1 Tax=Anisakis simplex TaxID=6269 RepID=A0A0M3JSE2_ANISI|nr:unnamed protein product [Anisakis simplex]